MIKRGTYRQVCELQRILLDEARLAVTRTSAKCQCAAVFAQLEYLKRVMRMKPNPKPVEVVTTGEGRSLIDYRKLVRRPSTRQIIDVTEPKPPGPRTDCTAPASGSGPPGYYARKVEAGEMAPKLDEQGRVVGLVPASPTTTGSVPADPAIQKPVDGSTQVPDNK